MLAVKPMGATATRLRAEEFYARTVPGDHKQLVDGEIVVNEPKLIHALLQGRLYVALQAWVAAGPGRGFVSLPTDVRMDEHNVYGPDLVWFREEHVPADLDAYPEHVPDLCIEVRSQSTWRYDIGAKKRVYESGGLPELWLVDDTAGAVLVYRRSSPRAPTFDVALELRAGETLESPQLPGFALSTGELFER
ncbi:MAG: Uma2 family endonuclease [Solirubrobacterales bacterium]|nr:Uma2 family endonuclease [Solirubrobacterales bacterium]